MSEMEKAEGYLRGTFNVIQYLRAVQIAAQEAGFIVEHCYSRFLHPIMVLKRVCPNPSVTLYISAGMHGDEPAGPLAILRLLKKKAFPDNLTYTIFPLLNPAGMQDIKRENFQGIDINRDYKRFETPEAQCHRDWLKKGPKRYDLCVNLHEDWESTGYYLYEDNPDCEQSIAEKVLEAVRPIIGIDHSNEIDGFKAANGIIRPRSQTVLPGDDYPETLFLMDHYTRHSYTFETPSNSKLLPRIHAHEEAVKATISSMLDNGHWFDI